jgi:PqqD family protein of HPr-rel-A system
MQSETSPIYAARENEFSWEEWDQRFVLFHRASQKTHYLNQTSAIVLQCLVESPHTADALADTLAQESGEPLSDELRSNIAGLLQRLETQGLAMRVQTTDHLVS